MYSKRSQISPYVSQVSPTCRRLDTWSSPLSFATPTTTTSLQRLHSEQLIAPGSKEIERLIIPGMSSTNVIRPQISRCTSLVPTDMMEQQQKATSQRVLHSNTAEILQLPRDRKSEITTTAHRISTVDVETSLSNNGTAYQEQYYDMTTRNPAPAIQRSICIPAQQYESSSIPFWKSPTTSQLHPSLMAEWITATKPFNEEVHATPVLTSVNYIHAEILAKAREKKDRAIQMGRKEQQSDVESLIPLRLDERILEKILTMPTALQSATLKLIEQQNEIRILELQLKLKSIGLPKKSKLTSVNRRYSIGSAGAFSHCSTFLCSKMSTQRNSSQKMSQASSTKRSQESTCSRYFSTQQTSSDESLPNINKSSLTEMDMTTITDIAETNQLSKTLCQFPHNSNTNQSDWKHQCETYEPCRIPLDKLLSLNRKQPITLDEIKEINEKNLKLTSNGHIPLTVNNKSQKLGDISQLQSSDKENVKQMLLKLNPEWVGCEDELMMAMHAHLAGESVTFRNGSVQQLTKTHKSCEIDKRFNNVCHVQTHNLEIRFIDPITGQCHTRQIPFIRIYNDPPVIVMPEFFSFDECKKIISLTSAHWKSIDAKLTSEDLIEPNMRSIAKLPRQQSELVDRLLRRAAAACLVSNDDIEDMYMLRYRKGEGAKEHLESLNRRSTLLVYLNEISLGGETDFVKLGFQIRPQLGTALLWHNIKLHQDSTLENLKFESTTKEERMLHASLPIESEEEKFIILFYIKNPNTLESSSSLDKEDNDTKRI